MIPATDSTEKKRPPVFLLMPFYTLAVLFPVFYNSCLTTFHRKRIRRNVLRDSRACRSSRIIPDSNRRYQICVTADKCVVAYCGAVLLYTVIVCRYTAAAEVYALAHIAVADICKMRYAGVYADFGVLDLYKVAYLYAAVQMSIRTQMYKRTCLSLAVYLAFVRLYVVKDNVILYNAVGYIAVRTYLTAVADNRFSLIIVFGSITVS